MFDNLRNTLDFDDLLFEKRNRAYGAYYLRKRYNAVVSAGILLTVVLAVSVVVLPFVIKPGEDKVIAGGISYVQVNMEDLKAPVEDLYVPPPPPRAEAEKMQETVKYVPPVVVDTLPLLEQTQAAVDEVLASSPTEAYETGASGTGDDIMSGQDGIATDDAFFIVEVMPTFKGGDINKFREWVIKRTAYPQAAVENHIQGKVYLTFIIETDGSVSNVTVVKGVNPLIDNEAVRTIKSSPKWTPGLQRGLPVRVRYSMALSFSL